ncbi:hypothetical protein WAI453_012889 [Rhynchosporium graminicola]
MQDAPASTTLPADNIHQLMTVNNALLDVMIDIKQLLENERQVAYPGNLPATGRTSFAIDRLDVWYFPRICGGHIVWTLDPEEHLEFDRTTESLKFMRSNLTDDRLVGNP